MNENALKARLVRLGYTYEAIAKELGISKNAFWRKITNKNDFNLPEIQKLKIVLKLEEPEFNEIFFTEEVETEETK